jgi:hypothetical protein
VIWLTKAVDWSAEWEAYLTYLDMDTVDFSAPDGPNDWPLTLQDCGGIENELATQDGDPASQHPRSVLPVDMPAVLDILDPSLPFHTGVLMSPTTAALGLNTAPLPPHLAPELILNTPLHSPSRGLPASSGVPQLPGTDSDASPGLNRGSSAETRQSQYVTVAPRERSLRIALIFPVQANEIDLLQVPDVRGLFRQKGNPRPAHTRAEARCAIRRSPRAGRASLPNPGMQEVRQRKGLQATGQTQGAPGEEVMQTDPAAVQSTLASPFDGSSRGPFRFSPSEPRDQPG